MHLLTVAAKNTEMLADLPSWQPVIFLPNSAENPSPLANPNIVTEVLAELRAQVETEKQVIVHCCFHPGFLDGMLIRIWKSTFLIDEKLHHKSPLIHHENISLFPYWTEVPPNRDFWFTLVFSGLPHESTSFTLKEEIPEDGGFLVQNIQRNSTDVYRVRIT